MTVQSNERRYVSRLEAFLIHVGHFVWLEMLKARKSKDVHQEMALYEAVESVWEAKRQLRAEMKAERAGKTKELDAYFAEHRAA